jgi:TorA maturation chaperone TorD
MHSIRSELYTLAAGLFDVPRPGRDRAIQALALELLESELTEQPWRRPLRALARELAREEAPKRVTAEYLRLFVLPLPQPAASLFATHWLQDKGYSACQLEHLMAAHGLGASDAERTPDHICAELAFMGHLAQNSPKSTQRHFLRVHLGRWTPRLIDAIRSANAQPRFAFAADFLEALIQWDIERLEAGWQPQLAEKALYDWASA